MRFTRANKTMRYYNDLSPWECRGHVPSLRNRQRNPWRARCKPQFLLFIPKMTPGLAIINQNDRFTFCFLNTPAILFTRETRPNWNWQESLRRSQRDLRFPCEQQRILRKPDHCDWPINRQWTVLLYFQKTQTWGVDFDFPIHFFAKRSKEHVRELLRRIRSRKIQQPGVHPVSSLPCDDHPRKKDLIIPFSHAEQLYRNFFSGPFIMGAWLASRHVPWSDRTDCFFHDDPHLLELQERPDQPFEIFFEGLGTASWEIWGNEEHSVSSLCF